MKKRIAIVAGGDSDEREISLKSAQTVLDNIDREQFSPYLVDLSKDGWVCHVNSLKIPINRQDFSVDVDGEHKKFDSAFITIHGTPGEDGTLQGYFDLIDMPYSTVSRSAATLTFNKWMCNKLLRTLGYDCADSILLRNVSDLSIPDVSKQLGYPCFVKPNDSGSSYGVKKVNQETDLMGAVKFAFEYGKEVLIESFLEGVEVSNGVYSDKGLVKVLPITEIVTQNEFFDYGAKYDGESQEITPARITDQLSKSVKKITSDIFKTLGLKGMARIDYMIVKDKPYVIEINTTPGLSPQSFIPQQVEAEGLTLKEFFTVIINESLI